jgi:hypothetical protein
MISIRGNGERIFPAFFAAALILPLSLKGGRFSPETLSVPEGIKFQIVLSNEDAAPVEFESFSLHREQVIMGNGKAVIFLGPLKKGLYDFFDDFHSKTKGRLEVVAASPST